MERKQAMFFGWASCLIAYMAAGSVHAAAIELGQLDLRLSRELADGSIVQIGTGYLRYDAGGVRQQYEDWVAELAACEADENACDDVRFDLDLEYPVVAASFTMYGHTFGDDEIRWTDIYNYTQSGTDLYGIRVDMGRGGADPFLYFEAGDEEGVLEYEVLGNLGYCTYTGGCSGFEVGVGWDEDYRSFDWREVPVPASEPGSRLTFLAAFLALLAVSRRPAARPLRFR